jgi:signal transduction histidine kinase
VTSGGIDNFRDTLVATFSMREGLYADGASSVIAAHDGTVWVGNFEALNFVRNNKVSAIREDNGLPGRNVTTLFEDHAGRLWLGVDNGLWVYDQGRFQTVRHSDGSALGIVFAITEDIDHSIWVRAGPNLDRIQDLRVQNEFTSPQIITAYIMAANPKGGVFLGLVDGDLVRFRGGKTETFRASESDNRQIRDLLVEADGSVWGTTLEKLVRWKDGQRRNLTTRNGLPCDGIYAMLKDKSGSLWLSARCGLITIAGSELEYWWKHPDSRVKWKLIGPLDGVRPGLTSLKPQMAQTPDGRLWFVNATILQMFDPDHVYKNLILPPVHIEQIVADRQYYIPQDGLRLPPLTRDLEIDYAALSFVVPQKVRYRYKLEGRDTDWQDPQNRHQAIYSDLPPGNYRFHVIACNNDGLWNETGATWNFRIEPALYQTGWFRLLCVACGAFSLWLLYRLRLKRMRETINARFDERMAERTRLARELHDTLLQTIQGSRMVADDALEESVDMDEMRSALKRLSSWLAQATEEGRAALNSLRTSITLGNDLAEAFESAARECSEKSSMEFALVLEGTARRIHPIVRDEVFRIGYEAIRNACSHSGGSRLEVDLTYARDLVLRVRDNGKGIHPEVAARGRDGHFGLKGMQERALRIGGNLSLSSSLYSGTEVELIVPGNIVFTETRSTRRGIFTTLKARLGLNKSNSSENENGRKSNGN